MMDEDDYEGGGDRFIGDSSCCETHDVAQMCNELEN